MPIALGDVLVALHSSLHTQISHLEWARLSPEEEIRIARAYTKRCKKNIAPTANLELSQGVKQVDFLRNQVIFRGLVRTSPNADGVEVFRLVLGSSS